MKFISMLLVAFLLSGSVVIGQGCSAIHAVAQEIESEEHKATQNVSIEEEKSEPAKTVVPIEETRVQEPEDLGDAAEFLPAIISAAKNGNWLLFGALISLIVTFAVRKYVLPKLKLGNGVLPLVSAAVGIVAGVGGAVAGGADLSAASLAVLSGPLASTLWSAIVKYFAKK